MIFMRVEACATSRGFSTLRPSAAPTFPPGLASVADASKRLLSVDAVHVDAQSPLAQLLDDARVRDARGAQGELAHVRGLVRHSKLARGRPRTCGTRCRGRGGGAGASPSPRRRGAPRGARHPFAAHRAANESSETWLHRREARRATKASRAGRCAKMAHNTSSGASERSSANMTRARGLSDGDLKRASLRGARERRLTSRSRGGTASGTSPGGCRPRRRRRRPWRCPPRAARAPRRTRAGAPRSPRAPRP